MNYNDIVAPDHSPKSHPPGYCLCCGNALPSDRKMMCNDCIDPNGATARIARMLRGKYGASAGGRRKEG